MQAFEKRVGRVVNGVRVEAVTAREVQGTGLVGHLTSEVGVRQLRAAFGAPVSSPDGKSERVWRLRFQGEVVATVYDYRGERWHIGGRSTLAVELVVRALDVPADHVALASHLAS